MIKPQIDLTGAKILAVDDVPANLDVLSQALEADGYNVLVATSGETALEVVTRIAPDLILLDVMMPGINGFETCRRLKTDANRRDIPVIFLTARGELEDVLEGFFAGGVDYIAKPFQKEEVLIRIRTHLERARLARELAELNAHLEQKVAERTRQLQQKVKELEGKDRIAQHLLTVHSLDETLNVVLDVVCMVMGVETAVIYLKDGDNFTPRAALGAFEPGVFVSGEQLAQLSHFERQEEAFESVCRDRVPFNAPEAAVPFALVPILRGDELLGVIEVDNHQDRRSISDDVLNTLTGFALQAAVAIRDAEVQQDATRWKAQLEAVLSLDEVADGLAFLNELPGEEENRT